MTAAESQTPSPIPRSGDAIPEIDRRAVGGFLLRFAVIAIALALVPFLPGWDTFVAWFMSRLAVLVNAFLHLLGQPTQVEGVKVFSHAYNVVLEPHCSALDIMLFFSATVLAIPTHARQKIAGLVAGGIAITALNVLRIATVYLVGAHSPAHVEDLHARLWPVLLVMATVALCALWLCWANTRRAS